jgi:NADH dehydrogenase (ubiquinone) 1 alpha subcomplex subunit 5
MVSLIYPYPSPGTVEEEGTKSRPNRKFPRSPFSHRPPSSHPSHTHPNARRLTMQRTLPSLMKRSTSIAGLLVEPKALPHLATTYRNTLTLLSHFPPSYTYRQATEALTQHRLNIVNSAIEKHNIGPDGNGRGGEGAEGKERVGEKAIEEVEKAFGSGGALGDRMQVEEMLEQARTELGLVGKMLEWKRSVLYALLIFVDALAEALLKHYGLGMYLGRLDDLESWLVGRRDSTSAMGKNDRLGSSSEPCCYGL